MPSFRPLTICLGVCLLAAGSLFADPLSVVNSSFEASTGYNGGSTSAVPGWTAFSSTYGQVTNSTAQFTSGLTGNNAIYLNGGISQTTGSTFVAGTIYKFTVDVGNPSGVADPTSSSLTFGFRNAGNTAYLGSGYVSTAQEDAIPNGTFQTFSFSYTATAADAGNAIQIAMQDYFASDASSYRLDNVTVSTVPEPATYLGGVLTLSSLGLALVKRKRKIRA